jgi:hypothetical protein
MADAVENTSNEANSTRSDVTLTLSNEVLAKLQERVAIRTVGDVHELVADAINSYVHLGQLAAGGSQIYAKQGDDGTLVRLHFPFSSNDNA